MPDEGLHPALINTGQKRLLIADVFDNLFEYAAAFPSEMVNGWPRSWRRFVLGLRYLDRADARIALRDFETQHTSGPAARSWIDEKMIRAGWRR